MKRKLFIILAFVLIFSLVSCKMGDIVPGDEDNENDNKNDDNNMGNVSEKFDIVMVAKQEGIPWFDDMKNGVEDFGRVYANEVNARQLAPEDSDSAKQIQIIENLIEENVDAICVVPIDPEPMSAVLEKAKEKGIIVVSHGSPSLVNTVDYNVEAFKNRDFGVLLFDLLAKAMGGVGEFAAMVEDLTFQTQMEWYNAGMEHIKENYPDIKMVLKQPLEDNNNDAAARQKAVEVIKAYPKLKGFAGVSMSSGANFSAVLRETENQDVDVVSLGLPTVIGPHLKNGYMAQGLIWRPADVGYAACLTALKILRGEKIESGMNLDKDGYRSITLEDKMIYGNAPLVLTAETVDNYAF